jgi:shikimate kinase
MPLLTLIGYRGSGKSTIGPLLAARLGWAFVDADALLEQREQTTIRAIFATEGEAAFRAKEAALLAELMERTNTVVATGGGVVLRADNRAQLRRSFVVWLAAEPETLWERLQGDPLTRERRPNLAGGGLAEVRELLTVREPLYRECANLEIPVGSLSPEAAVDAILAAWNT